MRRVLVLLMLTGVLAACGSDGPASGTSEGRKYVDALMKSYRTGKAKNAFTESEARCIAENVIDTAGITVLKKAGVTPSNIDHGSAFAVLGSKLSSGQADTVTGALVEANCVNVGAILVKSGAGDSAAFSRVPKAKVRCIFAALGTPKAARQAFADSLLGLPRGDAEFKKSFQNQFNMMGALSKCKVDPSLLK